MRFFALFIDKICIIILNFLNYEIIDHHPLHCAFLSKIIHSTANVTLKEKIQILDHPQVPSANWVAYLAVSQWLCLDMDTVTTQGHLMHGLNLIEDIYRGIFLYGLPLTNLESHIKVKL